MSINTKGQLPDRILIDGNRYWQLLSFKNMTFHLSKEDCVSIIESIIAKFMSLNDPDLTEYHVSVPDFNRMRNTTIKDNPEQLEILMKVIQQIENDLYINFSQSGIFEENHQFSYMFDKLLGSTIIIFKLPH